MKIWSSAVMSLLFASAEVPAAEQVETEPKTISIEALSKLKIIGKLGIPLGKYAEFKAKIVAEGSLRGHKEGRNYRLKITSVAGKDLKEPVTIGFRKLIADDKFLPDDLWELRKSKTAGAYKEMTEELMDELEKDYVGSEVKFTGYETAILDGLPDGMPDPGTWGGGGEFGLYSILVVIPPDVLK